jgi:hypothetical protein
MHALRSVAGSLLRVHPSDGDQISLQLEAKFMYVRSFTVSFMDVIAY